MRIGIDARLLSGPLTGIGQYTAELSRKLVKLNRQTFPYTLGEVSSAYSWATDCEMRCGRCRHRLCRMLWSHTLLPRWAAQDRVDVSCGATHRLPTLLPSSLGNLLHE
jgi:hypothetical protein